MRIFIHYTNMVDNNK